MKITKQNVICIGLEELNKKLGINAKLLLNAHTIPDTLWLTVEEDKQ